MSDMKSGVLLSFGCSLEVAGQGNLIVSSSSASLPRISPPRLASGPGMATLHQISRKVHIMPPRRRRSSTDPDQLDLLDIPEATAVMLTYSGRTLDLESPDFSRFDIEDIARPLAYQCRFVGNTRAFYSVAQHCVLASELAPAGFEYEALMHDSEEAFTGDWPTPWKVRIGRDVIKAAIEPLKAALAARFGFSHPQPDAVKLADQRSLATELRDLCAPHRVNWHDLPPPAEAPIVPLAPDDAMAAFIKRYHQLRPGRINPM
jgi:5'-deoxynucleotidase YfbR-like HD superfamily hydrolase